MATTLYLAGDPSTLPSDWSSGNNDAGIDGSTSRGWINQLLSTSRGNGVASVTTSTVAGPTPGIETRSASVAYQWISPPLDADVTIAGSITWNIRAAENNMSANVAINGRLEVIDGATGAFTLIDQTARVTELGTTEAAANFAETPAAGILCKRGDRLRVRIFGDDAGTMASGFTFTVWVAGQTAGASGDSYLTLTENLTFVSEPAGSQVFLTDTTPAEFVLSDTGFLSGSTYENVDNGGAAWTNPSNASASDNVYASLTTAAFPTDHLVCRNLGLSIPAGDAIRGIEIEVEAKSTITSDGLWVQLWDGATIGTGKQNSSLGTSDALRTFGGPNDLWGAALTEAMVEGANFGVALRGSSVSGGTITVDLIRVKVYHSPRSAKEREAWTARGVGVQTDVTNTAAGWTAPIQVTDTAGGTVVEWYTKQLAAFTLGGAVRCNIRAAGSSFAANVAMRVEIAIVDSDGTNPVVWGAMSHYSALTTSEVARSFLVSGDDVSVLNGKRLRIRALIDDFAETQMGSGHTVTVYYAGTTGGASGDTFLTFSQTLTEFVSAADTGQQQIIGGGYMPTYARAFLDRVKRRYWRSGWERRPSGVLVPA